MKRFKWALVIGMLLCLQSFTLHPLTGYEKKTLSPASSDSGPKTAYLTFDDGPSSNTAQILDHLRTFNIKGTFFVVGNSTAEGQALLRRMVEEGHAIGNHTYSHDYSVVYKSVDTFKRDVEKLNALLEQTTGKRPDILRFPGGSNNHQARKYGGYSIMNRVVAEMEHEGYALFDWNVSSTDAARTVQSRDAIVDAVVGGAEGKQNVVVLMHDANVKTTTVEALPDIIVKLSELGYRFDVLRKDSVSIRFLRP
ncbi:MAG: hypothetical protein K0Q59_5245 [Paenibacillus sp.]|nr:hypothetical protein [Paenibacillus sp.]